jgi:hypothetical protein
MAGFFWKQESLPKSRLVWDEIGKELHLDGFDAASDS